MKKEAFIIFYSKKSTEHEVLHKLVKATCTITELNLDLKEIDGKAFDGGVNINGPDTQGMLIKNGRVLPTPYLCPLLWPCAQPYPSGYYNTD